MLNIKYFAGLLYIIVIPTLLILFCIYSLIKKKNYIFIGYFLTVIGIIMLILTFFAYVPFLKDKSEFLGLLIWGLPSIIILISGQILKKEKQKNNLTNVKKYDKIDLSE